MKDRFRLGVEKPCKRVKRTYHDETQRVVHDTIFDILTPEQGHWTEVYSNKYPMRSVTMQRHHPLQHFFTPAIEIKMMLETHQ